MTETRDIPHTPKNLPEEVIDLDSPIKKDVIDFEKLRQISPGSRQLTIAGIILGETIVLPILEGQSNATPSLMMIAGVAMGASYFLGAAYKGDIKQLAKIEKNEKRNSVIDKELQYRADRLVYSGDKPLRVGSKSFKKGTNYYFIDMPTITATPNTIIERIDGAHADLDDYVFNDLRAHLEERSFEFVAIDPHAYDLYRDHASSLKPVGDLLSGKDTKLFNPDSQLITLTREEFEHLTASAQELFLKAANALDDKIFSDMVGLIRSIKGAEDVDRLKEAMLGRLNSVLSREVESHFNSLPETMIERVGQNQVPVRKKIFMQSAIKRTEGGMFFVQTNTANGEIRWVPLDKLLKTSDVPVEDIISTPSAYHKAQLSYVLHQMLIETPIEDLIRERAITRSDVIAGLVDAGIAINALSSGPRRNVDNKSKIKKTKRSVGAALSGLALLMGLTTAASGAVLAAKATGIIDNRGNISLNIPGVNPPSNPEQQSRPGNSDERGFGFSGLPSEGLNWAMTGNIPTGGYYITGTSHEFKDGHWAMNEDVYSKINLPKRTNYSHIGNYISVFKNQALNQFGETEVRIPLRENTKISEISMTGDDGKPVDFETFELTDGVIVVKTSAGILGGLASVTIDATMVPSVVPEIHATSHIEGIDAAKFSGKAKALLDQAKKDSEKDISQVIFDGVRNGHLYSIDPPDKNNLNNIKSVEDAANIIAELSACSCDVCNTEAVIAANAINNPDVVNIAYGFANSGVTLAGADGGDFLRTETEHTFAVNQYGDVLDATASEPAKDKLTQEYIEILKNPTQGRESWEKANNDAEEYAQSQKKLADILKITGGGLLGLGGLFAARQLTGVLRKRFTKEQIAEMQDRVITKGLTSGFSNGDLEKAYNFFGWLSYGKTEYRIPTDRLNFKNKADALARIRGNVSFDKLAAYLEDSKALDRIAEQRGFKLSVGDQIKLRALARHLLS